LKDDLERRPSLMGHLVFLKARMATALLAMSALTFIFLVGVNVAFRAVFGSALLDLIFNAGNYIGEMVGEITGKFTFGSGLSLNALLPLQENWDFTHLQQDLQDIYWAINTLINEVTQGVQWNLAATSWLEPYTLGGLAFLTGMFMLFEWFIGPSVAAKSLSLKYVASEEAPWLHSVVEELSRKSGIPKPKIAVAPYPVPNACVFGRTIRGATLAVTEGLLENLNADEVKAVISHELGHLRHKDCIVLTLLNAIPTLCFIIATFTMSGLRLSYRPYSKRSGGILAIILFVIGLIAMATYIVTLLVVRYLSRMREFYADVYAAYLTHPSYMKSALAKIAYGLSTRPMEVHGARAFFVEDPATASKEIGEIISKMDEYDLNKDGVLDEKELQLAMEKEAEKVSRWNKFNMLFSTHPPTFKRILLLSLIEKELRLGRFTKENIYKYI